MKTNVRENFSGRIALLDLLACVTGFAFAVWLYSGNTERSFWLPWRAEWFREVAVSAAITWAAVAFTREEWTSGVRVWIDRFFTAAGMNLMLQYGLAYAFHIVPTPWPVVVSGSILVLVFLDLLERFLWRSSQYAPPVLLVGSNSIVEELSQRLGARVAGVVPRDPAQTPESGPALGEQLDQAVASGHAGCVVMADAAWPRTIPPRHLLALRYTGIDVKDGRLVFEDLLQRVSWENLDPLELLTAASLSASRSAVALQAVYTNLIGLGLLLATAPVLILFAAAVLLTTWSDPFDGYICPGFQRIPFRLLRFRTRRPNGDVTLIGKLIETLHLTHWPRLINVVRGEMALFGPPPVRTEFVDRLNQLLFAYVHRFAVKPGLMGWSQCNLPGVSPAPDEMLRLQYDLYYAKQESPSLDLDILLRTVFRLRLPVSGVDQLGGRAAAGSSWVR